MHQSRRLTWLPAICMMCATAASAQTTTTTSQPSSPQSSDASTRPAATTFDGDTGLWYVPTAETLGRGAFAASIYRSGFDYVETATSYTFTSALAVEVLRRLGPALRPLLQEEAGPTTVHNWRPAPVNSLALATAPQ